jgi:hypothetical protein
MSDQPSDQPADPSTPDDARIEQPVGPHPRTVRAVRGVFSATLTLEALVVLFVPRAVAQFGTGLTATKLVILVVLAVLLVATALVVKRRWALVVGSVLQLAIIACGVMTSAMYVLGAIFGAIWLYELQIRKQLLAPRRQASQQPPTQ